MNEIRKTLALFYMLLDDFAGSIWTTEIIDILFFKFVAGDPLHYANEAKWTPERLQTAARYKQAASRFLARIMVIVTVVKLYNGLRFDSDEDVCTEDFTFCLGCGDWGMAMIWAIFA
jgi:hypothetical protein